MIKILIGIVMLCAIVTSHELGHMIVAKLFKIEVKEFWVGFGPKLFGFEKGGTKYSFRIIPLGGACVFDAIEDMDSDENADNVPELKETENVSEADGEKSKYIKFTEASVWARICTLFAGPLFNFILAFLMGIVVMAFSYMPSTRVTDVTKGSPAQVAGIEAGDTIVSINSSRVYLYPEVSMAVQTGIGRPLNVVYKRGNAKYKTQIIPEMNDEYGYYMIGVSFGSEEDYAPTFADALGNSLKYVRYMIKMTYSSIRMLLTGDASARDLSGAVGVVSIVSDEYDAAAAVSSLAILVSMLNLAVLISANLGVVNLLPLPALDGGRLIFAFYEAITGRKVNEKIEGVVNAIGMILLMLLFVFTVFNDVLRLFGI